MEFGRVYIRDFSIVFHRSVAGPGSYESNVLLLHHSHPKRTENSNSNLLLGYPALRMIQVNGGNDNKKMQFQIEPPHSKLGNNPFQLT